MISNLLTELKEAYDSLRTTGGALEGVKSVRVGDNHPISDREMPCLTLDCTDVGGVSGSAQGTRNEWTFQISVALYTSDARPGIAQLRLWDLITPPSPSAQFGLRYALQSNNQLRLSNGSLFHLSAGPIRMGAIRDGSTFTAGAVSTLTATSWGPTP